MRRSLRGEKVRTENFKRGMVPILLVFALVFSMISVAPFASSGNLISHPGGTTIEVVPGSTFIFSQRLVWDEPENGDYIVTIYWEAIENKPSENFTFVEVSAYFVTGPYENESIEASFTFKETVSPYTGNLLYTLGVRTTVSDNRDGEFNVDITLRASGAGGVPHVVGDHLIEYSMIVVSEARMLTFYPDPVTVHVLQSILGVEVSLSPESKSGSPGETLTFAVTVRNTGGDANNYELTISDDAGWGPTLAENLLTIPAGENRTTTVSVTVPSDAIENETTGIAVTASSQADSSVSDNDTSTAIAAKRVPPSGPPIPISVIGVAAIGVGAVAVIVLLLKRGLLHLSFLRSYSRAHHLRLRRQWFAQTPTRSIIRPW